MIKIKNIICCLILFMTLFQEHVSAMTTQGDRIINSNGEEVQLKGVNWFGFNNGSTMVDGLWNSGALASDFATIVYRMQLLGFNAVRLPFSFIDLYNLAPRNYAGSCQLPSVSSIQMSVTNPSVSVPSNQTIPPMVAPVAGSHQCNDYFPNDTTLNRFLWTVNFFAKNGFYVLIDNHLREDQTVLQNRELWLQQWKDLVTKISQDPTSKKMLMIDILNEPDQFGIRWEANGQTPALKDLYLSVMDAIYPINSQVLFFIEGTGQGGIGANWGDGFATDPTLVSQNGLSSPKAFFDALMTKPYLNQVVISPHVYPPSVTGATQNFSGSGLYNRLTNSFGYLTQPGYCDGSCKTFPVAIGEFGSRFAAANDVQSMQDLAKYLNDPTTDGKHHAIKNWFYWAWNANSGDTGGIVADNWLDIVWQKINYLTTIGLAPWYTKASGPTKTGTICMIIAPTSGLAKSNLQPISVQDVIYQFSDFNLSVCHTLPVGTYTITPPAINTTTMQFTANPQTVTVTAGETTPVTISYQGTPIVTPPSGDFSVKVEIGTAWQENPSSGIYMNTINLYVKNHGAKAVPTPWTVTLANNAYKGVTNSWNVNVTSVSKGNINGTVQESWATLSPNAANTVNIGMIVSSTSSNFAPTSVLINGKQATITK